jgi:hypothetical protein
MELPSNIAPFVFYYAIGRKCKPRYASPTKTVFSTVKSPTDAAGNYSNISELLILKIKLRMFDT